MKSNYLNKTKIGIKSLLAGLFLFGSVAAEAQCSASFTYTIGANGNVVFSSTSTGTTISTAYSWNFGNVPNGAGQTASHTYTNNGWKYICLSIVSNTAAPQPCTSTFCDSLQITNVGGTVTPCSANFSHVSGSNGSVSFVSTSTGTTPSTTYAWSFGDGGVGSGLAPSHSYASNGYKMVCLTITDLSTSCSDIYCDSVAVNSVSTSCNANVVYTLSKDSTQALTWDAFPSYPANVTNATWTWGDGSTTTGLYPSHTYSAAGTYSTCVTVSVSCGNITGTYCYVASIFKGSESNAMVTVNVRNKASNTTGIASQLKDNNLLTIYPNPSNGIFTIELSGVAKNSKELSVSLYNMLGEMVIEKNNLPMSSQSIDVSTLSNGTYFVKVRSENGSYTKKIMIQK